MNGRGKLILLACAAGFVLTGIEVRWLHRDVTPFYPQGWIPIIYCGLAVLACLAGLASSSGARWFAALIFFLGIPVGGAGLYFHTEGEPEHLLKMLAQSGPVAAAQEREERDEREEHKGRKEANPKKESSSEEDPPALAPLGIAGLATIALIVAVPGKEGAKKRK